MIIHQKERDVMSKVIDLADLISGDSLLDKNEWGCYVDIGKSVLCYAFVNPTNPRFNPIEMPILDYLGKAPENIQKGGFRGLVIASLGGNWAAGANLKIFIQWCENGQWDLVKKFGPGFQRVNQLIKYNGKFPAVAAVDELCLGGGWELAMCAHRIVAAQTLKAGLVEVSAGLIPGATGNPRLHHNMAARGGDADSVFKETLWTIFWSRVSSSADHARELGYLTTDDQIVADPAHLIYEAREAVVAMSEDFTAVEPPQYHLPSEEAVQEVKSALADLQARGKISERELLIGLRLVSVLSDGENTQEVSVSEQRILNEETKELVFLCKQDGAADWMKAVLKGKSLRIGKE